MRMKLIKCGFDYGLSYIHLFMMIRKHPFTLASLFIGFSAEVVFGVKEGLNSFSVIVI